jgi:tetratricopeptide (TPR) repeat protein
VYPKHAPESASKLYRAAFAEWGFDPLARPVAETVERIDKSQIRAVLLDALDDWALYEQGNAEWARLLELARKLEASAWAKRLRDPTLRDPKLRESARVHAAALDELAATAEFDRPMLIVVLSNTMRAAKLNPRPLLLKALSHNPNNLELTIALHLIGTNEYVTAFERIRALRPDSARACLNLAIARAKLSGPAVGFLGRLRYRFTDGPLVPALLERAIKLDPRSGLARHYLGVIEYDAERYELAVRHARDALRIEPTLLVAHRLLVTALARSGDSAGADAALAEATRFDPTNPMWLELRNEFAPNRAPLPRDK